MIELPQDFLNVLFALLIVLAGVNRSRRDAGAAIHRTGRLTLDLRNPDHKTFGRRLSC
jgi:hypothetical protein